MKIIIEPTTENSPYPKIELENRIDHISLETWVEYFKSILYTWGFSNSTIDAVFGEEE